MKIEGAQNPIMNPPMNRPMMSMDVWTAKPMRRNPKLKGMEIKSSVLCRPRNVKQGPDTRAPMMEPSGGILPVGQTRHNKMSKFFPIISNGNFKVEN